MIKTLYINW